MKIKNLTYCKKIINAVELFFAAVVVIGVMWFFINSIYLFIELDWSTIEAFYDFINRILIIIVGLELGRLLVTHDMDSISYLLMFVVARKVIRPESTSVDILLAIVAFVLLFVINKKLKTAKA